MFEDLDTEILQLLDSRKTKEAIKLIRQRKKIGFAEAKLVLEAINQQRKQRASAAAAAHSVAHRPAEEAHRGGAHTFDTNYVATAPERPRANGMAPGEVAPPKNPVVNAVIVLFIFVAGLWYLLRG